MKDVLWAILKLFAFLLLLPLIAASFIAFQTQVLGLPVSKEAWVLWGAATYVALNLFVYDFKAVYTSGNALVEKMIPFLKGGGYIIPIYTIVLIVVNVIIWVVGRGAALQPYFLFAIAFTLAMHLIMTAHEIYEGDSSVLKAHYLMTFGLILILAFFVISLLLAWAIPEYSVVGFIKSLASHTGSFYKAVYTILFVDK